MYKTGEIDKAYEKEFNSDYNINIPDLVTSNMISFEQGFEKVLTDSRKEKKTCYGCMQYEEFSKKKEDFQNTRDRFQDEKEAFIEKSGTLKARIKDLEKELENVKGKQLVVNLTYTKFRYTIIAVLSYCVLLFVLMFSNIFPEQILFYVKMLVVIFPLLVLGVLELYFIIKKRIQKIYK